jgi:hypothetical protein
MTMTVNNQRATPGIRSALDVPVTHGNKEVESALFRGVAKRNGTPVPMDGAALCSREENTTVVIGVSTCERCATSGKGGTGEDHVILLSNDPRVHIIGKAPGYQPP